MLTFVGVMATCLVVKVVAGQVDNIVGLFQDRERINKQAKRIKKWGECDVSPPIPRVITEEIKEDWQRVERGEIDPGEHVDCYRGYSAQRIADVQGREFAQDCDRCHACGAPDPESKAAQYRIRQRVGINSVLDEALKSHFK